MRACASLIYAQAVFLAFVFLQVVSCRASHNPAVTSDSISTGAVSAQQQLSDALAQHGRSQQQTATVLDAVSKGTITASKALSLLQDVADLRDCLLYGAAADRTSTAFKHSSDTTQQQQQEQPQEQQQQLREPSRGILIVAGGSHQLKNAYILLKLLAHPDIACKLPVEIVHYGPQEYDAPTAATIIYQLADGTGISVKFIDGSEVPPTGDVGHEPHKPPGKLTGFKAKVHALVWVTSFDHVIMLDSDNTPLTDPTPLLDSPAFKSHGSIFWPDFWTNQWMQPALYSLLGLNIPWEANPSFRACEAGQVVLDRLRHRDVLEYLWLLNTHSNSGIQGAELGVVGQCLWGDKDTYPIAFQLAGKGSDFYNVPHKPLQALSRPGGKGATRLTHAGMVHRAPWGTGPLMWLHRTAAGKFWPHCMVHGGKSCRIWAITTPVNQQQLLATVRDPSAMEMGTDQVDLEWWKDHCDTTTTTTTTSSSSGSSGDKGGTSSSSSNGDSSMGEEASTGPVQHTDGAVDSQQGECSAEGAGELGSCAFNAGVGIVAAYSNATALPCDLEQAVGALPIPVVRTMHLPAQVKRLLQAAQEVFQKSKNIRAGYQG